MILTEEQRLIRDTARAFATERLAPFAAEREAAGEIPRHVIAEMGALGLMGMTVPEEWGGAGADHVSYALALAEIAAGHGAISTVMSGHNSVGCQPLLRYGTEAQRARWLRPMAQGEILSCFCLTEPQGGSDAAGLTTRARREGSGWRLDGRKQFITSGAIADLALVFAVTDPDAGKRGISAFLVPTQTPGYVVLRREKKMGQNASDTCEIAFEGARVDEDALLGREGQGYRIALANLEGGRIGIAAQCIGMARAALERATAYARERKTFGKRIIEHQAVGFRLAEMAARLAAAEQLVLHAAALATAGDPCLVEASMAKLVASETAEGICSDAIQTFGGAGYMTEQVVERIYRDVRGAKIYEGT
ncbi:MAG: acyl-CoA dehydrogenase family protein, partial [Rhodospirillales bacterium]|nr:acyl-CoA dehydrogenase family protein [Rhodospirillales bacterium]